MLKVCWKTGCLSSRWRRRPDSAAWGQTLLICLLLLGFNFVLETETNKVRRVISGKENTGYHTFLSLSRAGPVPTGWLDCNVGCAVLKWSLEFHPYKG